MFDLIEGEVNAISSEGQGILRHDNFVIFVPFAAPGDIIKCAITYKKKNFAHGELIEVLKPSSERTAPLCRYYGNCGGCQLQHITYEAQLNHKRQLIEDAFRRIGKLPNVEVQPVIPATQNWAYRRHVTLKLRSQGQSILGGFISVDNHSLVEVQHCPIFITDKESCIEEVQNFLTHFSSSHFLEGSATIFKAASNQYILSMTFEKPLNFDPKFIEAFLEQHPQWVGIALHIGNKKTIWGQDIAFIEVDQMLFKCSPDVFTQNHSEQSTKIYKQIVSLFEHKSKSKILDLYCGIGISSLMLARQGHQLLGIEYNEQSIQFAKENAQSNGCKNALFKQGDVEKILPQLFKNEKFPFLIINPPRIGMSSKTLQEIVKHRPSEIAYISCMPSTLARDLKPFCEAGYTIQSAQPYDMFPQTNHVETLVHLSCMQ